ncbi:MAG: Phosphoenolpyruvate carboxylase [Verrucomicrobiales bacterium]|nr:Phosphoenolpyruvate carboxylase [Verrucomicrobiales bacterium]
MPGERNTNNPELIKWIDEVAELCHPEKIFWCNGSVEERDLLTAEAVGKGVLTELDQSKLPGCYYHRSNPNDVARVEQCTYICTPTAAGAGPTNNWADPAIMYAKLYSLLQRGMAGRTLYVIPYLMGPPGSTMTKVGIELTDSIYVVLNMRIMTRMGQVACDQLGDSSDFNRGLHAMLDVNPERRYICHFPQDNAIISVGSAYGGNALLGKKCLALRIGSNLAQMEGWMAEHMLILGVESPSGEKTYVAAAFPSACGKTNFAMMVPSSEYKGWKVSTVGDDIAWMKPDAEGRLRAVNPEAGYFGVVPGTNRQSNPNAIISASRDTLFTNVALTPDRDVWWEGKDGPPPDECLDWKGDPWKPGFPGKAAHPNSRFTAPMVNNPMLDPAANDPAGVPISAIIFGGRRANTVPLIFEAYNWDHGVYLGATMGSETTAAATGGIGQVRRDPMAMLPFCGYDMGDYFRHWLQMRKVIEYPPRIFHVNWFRKDEKGKFLWPGFGENMRVLQWIVDRCHGRADAQETALGWMPQLKDFNIRGMENFGPEQFKKVQRIDSQEWQTEVVLQNELFIKLNATLPKELMFERELLISRL